MKYAICKDYLEKVEKKIRRIAKKCQRYGNDFTYTVGDEYTKETKDEFGRKRYYTFVDADVEGTAKINDWEFIATMEIYPQGNVIRKYNTEIDVPDRFIHTENVCEHCNSKRFRNNLYIIHNVETDEWKQVGKNCLALYTHGLNAEYVAAWMDCVTELEDYNGHSGIHGNEMIDIREVIGFAAEVIDVIGYRNADKELPTRVFVRDMLARDPSYDRIKWMNKSLMAIGSPKRFQISDFYKKETEERVEKIIEYYKDLEDNSEFVRNIKLMIEIGKVTYRSLGYVCYMPEGYRRAQIKAEERRLEAEKRKTEREAEVNGHFGEIGERFKDVKVKKMVCLSVRETMYGISYFTKIVAEDGRVFYWSGSGFIQDRDIDTVSFTIKSHDHYKDIDQTKVTRCKIKYVA